MELSAALRMLQKTQVLRAPTRVLATFGQTRIQYHLVSSVEDLEDRARHRQGVVVSERPKIVTADSLKEQFEGFDEEARAFGDWLLKAHGEQLRALEYRFKNVPGGTEVLRTKPAEVAERIKSDINDIPDAALLVCPDAGWQIALMKLLLDQSRQSFGPNVRELESKGMFRTPDQKNVDEIESLFKRAAADRSLLGLLAAKLREYGLFGEYEDRFFGLVQS